MVRVGNVVEEKRFLGAGLALEKGLSFAQVHRADLGKIPIWRGEDAALTVPESNAAHAFTVGKGPAIVADVNARLGVERILGVAGHPKEFIEAMMCRAIEHGLCEVDILVIIIGGRFARAVIECHAHMIFTDSRRAIAARLQHLGQRPECALDHRRIGPVRQPALLLEICAVSKATGQQRVPRGGTHGGRRVGVIKHHRLLGERLELRRALRECNRLRLRPQPNPQIRARVADPHVISHHQDDVG